MSRTNYTPWSDHELAILHEWCPGGENLWSFTDRRLPHRTYIEAKLRRVRLHQGTGQFDQPWVEHRCRPPAAPQPCLTVRMSNRAYCERMIVISCARSVNGGDGA
jgi:hypothetical protein